MRYSTEQRQQISNDAKGKVVESLEWEENGEYWVMTFVDGSEVSIRLMVEDDFLESRNYIFKNCIAS
jgi:hypothetical protein